MASDGLNLERTSREKVSLILDGIMDRRGMEEELSRGVKFRSRWPSSPRRFSRRREYSYNCEYVSK